MHPILDFGRDLGYLLPVQPTLSTKGARHDEVEPLPLQRHGLPERVQMMALVTWALVAYGVTLIVTQSHLFLPLRQGLRVLSPNFLWVLFKCPKCFGFWVGVLLGLLNLWAGGLPHEWPTWLRLWAQGTQSSAVCWLLTLLAARLANNVSKEAFGADPDLKKPTPDAAAPLAPSVSPTPPSAASSRMEVNVEDTVEMPALHP